MQRQKQRAASNGRRKAQAAFVDTPRGKADRVYRAAIESIRQRERHSRLVAAGTSDEEQQASLRVACLCDELLFASARHYEQAVSAGSSGGDRDWLHNANALWHAVREYERRHRNCNESSRQFASHKAHKLKELALEYDLEASALLALKLALATYRKSCPDCELEQRPQTFVA
jgi:hypothetical protein